MPLWYVGLCECGWAYAGVCPCVSVYLYASVKVCPSINNFFSTSTQATGTWLVLSHLITSQAILTSVTCPVDCLPICTAQHTVLYMLPYIYTVHLSNIILLCNFLYSYRKEGEERRPVLGLGEGGRNEEVHNPTKPYVEMYLEKFVRYLGVNTANIIQ